jgi:hypothetical protein
MFHYHKSDFSQYIRENCLDSKLGLVVCDIDYVVRDYNRKLVMILEEKVNTDIIPYAEVETLKLVVNGLMHNTLGYTYLGTYIVSLGNSVMSDPIQLGKIIRPNEVQFKQILPETLTQFINFQIRFEQIAS